MSGQKDEAQKFLHALEERSKEEYVRSTSLIVMYHALEDIDKSFECFERILVSHDHFPDKTIERPQALDYAAP